MMKKLLKIINYLVKVIFAFIGVMAIISFFSKDSSSWAVAYHKALDSTIELLQNKIDSATDSVEQVKYTLEIVKLKKRKVYLETVVDRFSHANWLSILEENGIDGTIDYLKIDTNFDDNKLTKEERYYLIHELYEFKSIMEEDSSYRDEARRYLKKSLETVRADWNLYQYASFLAEDNESKSIALYKEAISISDDKKFVFKIKYNLAKTLVKFKQYDEGVKYYNELLEINHYKSQVLIALATLFNDHRAIEYFNEIEIDKFDSLDKKFTYMKAKENVAVVYLYTKKYDKAKEMLEELLEFYHDISTSNPETFIDIARVNRHLFFVYKALKMEGSQKESLKRAMFYYKVLNDVYDNKYMNELKLLKKLTQELGE